MAKLKVGAQLIIWGQRALSDFLGVLDEVASLGYEGIEAGSAVFAGFADPEEPLISRGLSLAGLHMSVDSADYKAVDEALTILNKADGHYLMFSGAGGKENSDDEYLRNSKLLEEYGRRARKLEVTVCYHNHWQEIISGARGTRIILENTSPEHVSLCVDTYWVKCGGLSPAEFVKENRERVGYLHLKDGTEEGIKKHKFTELGKGVIDFPAVMKAVKPLRIEWVVVEQDETNRTPNESMAISRKYLKEKLGL
jgi:sugar phosphate isomerase/epimerase